MKMTDEQIFEALRIIKNYCQNKCRHRSCTKCLFRNMESVDSFCNLNHVPSIWDVDKFEQIVKGE